MNESLKDLWEEALGATYSDDVARAMVLIDQCRAVQPEEPYIRLLHARNLTERCLLTEAKEVLSAIEHSSKQAKWRTIWLPEWAKLCEARGDFTAAESAYRELAALIPDEATGWSLLGSFLAKHGVLDEAEAAHRRATEQTGDVDEAYVNLGVVLRARGRLEEAAAAFERALELCPEYPKATAALADVRAALDLQRASEQR